MDQKEPLSREARTMLLVLMGAFTMTTVMFSVLVLLLDTTAQRTQAATAPGAARMVCMVMGIAFAALSVYWTTQRMATAKSPAELQTRMIVAFALSEAVCICGLLLYFLLHRSLEFWPFAALALIVDVLFIIPRVLEYPVAGSV